MSEQNVIRMSAKMSGEMMFILRDSNGKEIWRRPWQHNLVTNRGMTNCSQSNWAVFWVAGSSATPPAFNNDTLGQFLGWATGSTGIADLYQNSGSPNYIWTHQSSKRFNVGQATGTIQEIGLGAANNGTQLGIHVAVSPPIVKAADQILDVFYRMTMTPDLTPSTGSVIFDSVSYDYTATWMDVDAVDPGVPLPQLINWRWSGFLAATNNIVWSGPAGTITGKPSGTQDSSTQNAVVTDFGFGYSEWECFWDVDDGNVGGVKSASSTLNRDAGIQVEFNNPIPKTNNETLKLIFRFDWSRA